jgi:hypothetical protein
MTKKQITKEFFFKTVAPVLIAWFLFTMFKDLFTKNGVTDYFYIWIVCGIPFGIRRMHLWLIPRGLDIGGTAGVWALNFIVGGIIGGFVLVWRLACAVCYLFITIYRIVTYKNHITADKYAVSGDVE